MGDKHKISSTIHEIPKMTQYHTEKEEKCKCIDISYCGLYKRCLPKEGVCGEYALTKRGILYVYKKGDWRKVSTPKYFYFFDNAFKIVYFIDSCKGVLEKVHFEGRVLEANGRTLYDVVKGCWNPVCDLQDTESIVRITIFTDETEITIKPLDKICSFSKYSDFCRSDIKKSGKSIIVNVTSIGDNESKTLIYNINRLDCDGKSTLVNHIFLRLKNLSITSSSIGPLIATENITEGDLVRLVNTGSNTSQLRKIKDSGTSESYTSFTIGNNNPGQVAIDCKGNTYYIINVNGNVTVPDIGVINFASPSVLILKRNYLGTFVWARTVLNTLSGIVNIKTDKSNNVYVSFTYGDSSNLVFQNFDGSYLNVLTSPTGHIIGKLDTDGNWVWVNSVYMPNSLIGTSPIDISTDGVYSLGFAGKYISNKDAVINITTSSGTTNYYIAGSSGSYIGILDLNGVLSFITYASDAQFASIDMNSNGNMFVTGSYTSSSTFVSTNTDSILINLTGTSNVIIASIDYKGIWKKVISTGGTGFTGGNSIALDNKGGLYVYIYGTISDSDPIIIGNTVIAKPPDRGFVVVILKMTEGLNYSNLVYIMCEAGLYNGNVDVDLDGSAYISFSSVQNAIDFGTKFVFPLVQGQRAGFIAKVTNGSWIWAKKYIDEQISYTALDQQQNIYSVGVISLTFSIGKKSQDPQERLKGIAQTTGIINTEILSKFQSEIVDETQTGLFPSFDYGVNKDGKLDTLCSTAQSSDPTIGYFATSLSTTKLILNE